MAQEPPDTTPSDTVIQGTPAPETVQGIGPISREKIMGYRATARFLDSLQRRDNSAGNRAGPATAHDRLSLDLVVDETVTPIGRRFFEAFYSAWSAPEGAPTYSIRVGEQPTPGLTTRIVIFLDNERVLLFPLMKTQQEYIDAIAGQAARYVRQRLQRRLAPGSADGS